MKSGRKLKFDPEVSFPFRTEVKRESEGEVMSMYKRWMTVLLVILAVGASVPGCGKKDEEEIYLLASPIENIKKG